MRLFVASNLAIELGSWRALMIFSLSLRNVLNTVWKRDESALDCPRWVQRISPVPYSESRKVRVDRDDSGLSSLRNSSKACLESLYWLSACEK